MRGEGAGNQFVTTMMPHRRNNRAAVQVDAHFVASVEEQFDYNYGQCHSLAYALHQQTGWPIAGCDWEKDSISGKEIPSHIFLITPDGQSLDINGLHERGHHPEGFNDDWQKMSPEDLQKLVDEEQFETMESDRAEFTAQLMLGQDPNK